METFSEDDLTFACNRKVRSLRAILPDGSVHIISKVGSDWPKVQAALDAMHRAELRGYDSAYRVEERNGRTLHEIEVADLRFSALAEELLREGIKLSKIKP